MTICLAFYFEQKLTSLSNNRLKSTLFGLFICLNQSVTTKFTLYPIRIRLCQQKEEKTRQNPFTNIDEWCWNHSNGAAGCRIIESCPSFVRLPIHPFLMHITSTPCAQHLPSLLLAGVQSVRVVSCPGYQSLWLMRLLLFLLFLF